MLAEEGKHVDFFIVFFFFENGLWAYEPPYEGAKEGLYALYEQNQTKSNENVLQRQVFLGVKFALVPCSLPQ